MKYRTEVKTEMLERNGQWKADGCATWSVFNAGNTLVSINNAIVLMPRETYEGPEFNPECADYTTLTIGFSADIGDGGSYIPEDFAAVGGTNPNKKTYTGVGPVPDNDARVVISKVYVTSN